LPIDLAIFLDQKPGTTIKENFRFTARNLTFLVSSASPANHRQNVWLVNQKFVVSQKPPDNWDHRAILTTPSDYLFGLKLKQHALNPTSSTVTTGSFASNVSSIEEG